MKNTLRNVLALGLIICVSMNGYAQISTANNKSVMFAYDDSRTFKHESKISLSDKNISDAVPSLILGVRYMPTFTSLGYSKTDEGEVETTFVLGYGIGGLVGVNFNDHVGLEAEVIYSSLAQKYKTPSKIESEIELTYINVPLLLVLNTGYSKAVNFNVCAGPQVGINTGSKIQSNGTQKGDTVIAVLAVKPADLGIAYGAGLDFGPPNFKISIGFRGVYGLIDIGDRSSSITTNQYYVLERAHVKTYSGYIGLALGF